MAEKLKDIGSILHEKRGRHAAPGEKTADGTVVGHARGENPPRQRPSSRRV